MPESLAALLLAVGLDRVVRRIPDVAHPVAWFGSLAGRVFAALPKTPAWPARIAGALATASLVGLAAVIGALVEHTVSAWPSAARVAVLGALLATQFTARGLYDAARAVARPLASGDLATARAGLRSLCSRDPSELDEAAVAGSAIASVGENLTDSVVGPWLAYALFGLPGAMGYRAVNTLDAMVGYRGAFEDLGKASARLDDVLNWVPARLATLGLLGAGAIVGDDVPCAVRTLRRDRLVTPSPNGGHTMSTLGALLGVRIEKTGVYVLFGEGRAAGPSDVERAIRRVDLAAWLVLVGLAAGLAAAGSR